MILLYNNLVLKVLYEFFPRVMTSGPNYFPTRPHLLKAYFLVITYIRD